MGQGVHPSQFEKKQSKAKQLFPVCYQYVNYKGKLPNGFYNSKGTQPQSLANKICIFNGT